MRLAAAPVYRHPGHRRCSVSMTNGCACGATPCDAKCGWSLRQVFMAVSQYALIVRRPTPNRDEQSHYRKAAQSGQGNPEAELQPTQPASGYASSQQTCEKENCAANTLGKSSLWAERRINRPPGVTKPA